MNRFKKLIWVFFVIVVLGIGYVYAQTLRLQTYYPAPEGVYNTMAASRVVISNAATTSTVNMPGVNGDLRVEGHLSYGTIGAISDKRVKKDIVPIEGALDKISNLKGVYFYWDKKDPRIKTLNNRRNIGLISQEVEKILPELVDTDADGYKYIQYPNVVAVLVEAIKEQQGQIESLREEINRLKAK